MTLSLRMLRGLEDDLQPHGLGYLVNGGVTGVPFSAESFVQPLARYTCVARELQDAAGTGDRAQALGHKGRIVTTFLHRSVQKRGDVFFVLEVVSYVEGAESIHQTQCFTHSLFRPDDEAKKQTGEK